MSQPKVSVLIPVYNTEKYLRECLDSVIAQTLTDIEIICVDDGSTDRSSEILEEYAQKDSRIKVITKTVNEGLLLARKIAVAEATGQYICFLDSDDSLSQQDSIKTMLELIEQENTGILQFNVEVFGDVPEAIKSEKHNWLKVCAERFEGSFDIINACIENRYSWNLWNKIYKADICKQAYQHIQDIHLITAEDAYGYFMIACHAKSFKGHQSKPLYRYRLGNGSTTIPGITLQSFRNYAKEISIVGYIEDYLKEKGQIDIYRSVLNKLRQRFQNHTLKRFEELPLEDAIEGFQVFTEFYPPELLLDQYSSWKQKKYILASLGIQGYRKKAGLQAKIIEIIKSENDKRRRI